MQRVSIHLALMVLSVVSILCGCGGAASNNNITPIAQSGTQTSVSATASPTTTASPTPGGASPSPTPGGASPSPTPAAAAKLGFTVQPSNASIGSPIAPPVQVAVQDAAGNTVTTSTASVTIALGTNPGSGTLSGTTTVAAVNGVATFSNLSINNIGTGYTLVASSTGLTSATSSSFNESNVGVPAAVKFQVQPTNVLTGSVIAPSVQASIVDANGTVVSTSSAAITVALGANPGAATLGGTLTQNAVNGVATFNNLTLNKAGTGYTLTASATGLTSGTSTAFNDIRVLSFAAPVVQLACNGGAQAQNFTSGRYVTASGVDSFSCNEGNNMKVFLSNGNGTFGNGTTVNYHGTNSASLTSTDIDGDGNVDILVACSTEVNIMKGDGAGNFTNVGNGFPTGNNNSSLRGICFGAFTTGTRKDIAVLDTADGTIYVYPNTSTAGNPNLGNPVHFTPNAVPQTSLGFGKQLVAADVNGDGRPDLVAGAFTNPAIVVWVNSASGNINTLFPAANSSAITLTSSANPVLQSVTANDFNGDGRADIFGGDDTPTNANGITNAGNVLLALAAGGFAPPVINNIGGDPFSSLTADFNLDGIIDVGITNFTGLPPNGGFSDLEVLLGVGNGTFQPVKVFKLPDSSGRCLTIGDFNGDGLPDAIAGSNPAWVFINTSK